MREGREEEEEGSMREGREEGDGEGSMREGDWDNEKREGEEREQWEPTLSLWMRYYSGSFCDCPKLSADQSETKEEETTSLSSTPANHS